MAPRKGRRVRFKQVAAATSKGHRYRAWVIFWLFVAVFCAISLRLAQLQLTQGGHFENLEEAHVGFRDIDRPRGDIVDRTGRILATDRVYPTLCANPSVVEDPDTLARYLASRLGVDLSDIRGKLTQEDADGNKLKFVRIERWMPQAAVERLGSLESTPEPDALFYQPESLRFYPEEDLASHVLGFVNREGVGSEGLEAAFDRHLRSKPGRITARVDGQRKLLESRMVEFVPPTGGDDIITTLDAALQFKLERELDAVCRDTNAKYAMGVLMDPSTGAILALATRPAFDPNRYSEFSAEQRKNRAIVDVFEPGSAFKIVTASAVLEHGLITPEVEIDCENGSMRLGRRRIRDSHRLGIEPFRVCFTQSSNIAIIKVAALLGEERLEAWISRFGFGEPTGVELPAESGGIFRPRRQWSGYSMGSLPMGQEISVTMLQLAQAFSAIANGGVLVRPHLVSEIVSEEGETTYRHDAAGVRILSEQTAAVMRELCHQVVTSEDGTGRYAAIPEYRVGGKTGTAEIAKPGGGGYYSDRYTTVFAGFAPVADPRLTCVVVVREPQARLNYGGYVCGPVFKEVMRDALVRLNVPPEPMRPGDVLVGRNDGPGADPDAVMPRVEIALLEPIETASRPAGALELTHTQGDKRTGGPVLPSFIGKTKREAKRLALELGVSWDPQGAGRVTAQDPPPGTPLDDVRLCRLVFSHGLTARDHN